MDKIMQIGLMVVAVIAAVYLYGYVKGDEA